MVLVAMLLVVVAGCGDSGSDEQPVGERLAAAKRAFDVATYIGFTLTTEGLPDGVGGLESAKGTGTHKPTFTGEIQIKQGLSFTASLVSVDGDVYAELPFVGWTKIDPADYGAPDPTVLMDRSTGLSSLLTSATGTATDGSVRSGAAVLTKVTGTLPGKAVHALFPSSGLTPFQVTFALTDENVLDNVSMTGRFYGADHGPSTYSIELDLSADPVTVSPPE